jgi:hypothetical protein
MKYLFFFLFTMSSIETSCQNYEKINIPKGIVYKYCDKSIDEKARQLIKSNIADSSQYSLSGDLLIVGPVLWSRLKNINKLAKISGGNTIFIVDDKQLTGKAMQKIDDSRAVWDEIRKEINKQPFTIRKLNEKELKYYWSVISFDIDEPLLIVETKEHKYILDIMSKDPLKLMWLDEVPQ